MEADGIRPRQAPLAKGARSAAWAAPATPCWRSRACCRPSGDLQAPDAVRETPGRRGARLLRRPPRGAAARPRARTALRILACSPAARVPRGTIGAATSSPCCATRPRTTPWPSPPATPRWRWTRRWGRWTPARSLLALPMQIEARRGHILVLADAEGRTFADEEVQVAQAFAAATSATLAQLRMARRARRPDRPAGGAGTRGQDAERQPGPEPRAGAHQPRGGQHPGCRQRHASTAATRRTAWSWRPPSACRPR